MLKKCFSRFTLSFLLVCLMVHIPYGVMAKAAPPTIKELSLNGQISTPSHPFPVVKDHVLIPLKQMSLQMGATSVIWDSKQRSVAVQIPTLTTQRQYLSLLSGLITYSDRPVHPLPEKLQTLKLPKYPLVNGDLAMLHNEPLTLTIADKGYTMDYALYDYEFINGTLYVGADWLNTLFLAQVIPDLNASKLTVTYDQEATLSEKLTTLEHLVAPQSPEDALALWIHGQQHRSGALQYASLSPELKASVMTAIESGGKSWVTGGSSPSLGEVTITPLPSTDPSSKLYTLQGDEMLQGKVSGTITQKVTLQPITLDHQTYWVITDASGDLDYYSILGISLK